jgi:hypothetical protein
MPTLEAVGTHAELDDGLKRQHLDFKVEAAVGELDVAHERVE